MSGEARLVPLGDAEGRDRWSVQDGADILLVVVTADGWRVLDSACPHRGGPLADGVLRDGAVVCPWHWYTFDLVTGECRNATMTPARTYAVEHTDGGAYAVVPPRPVPVSLADRLRAHARGES